MGNFNKGDRFGGKKNFDNDRGFRGRNERSERPQMHKAICADCGRECEVPFRPTGDRPVFCSDCFGEKKPSENRFERRDMSRPSFNDKPMYEAVCDKCHKTCEVPFRPTGEKPVFCSDCFGRDEKNNRGNSVDSSQYKNQFEVINTKLDNILKMLSSKTQIEKIIEEKKPSIMAPGGKIEKKIESKKVDAMKKKITLKKIDKKKDKKKNKK